MGYSCVKHYTGVLKKFGVEGAPNGRNALDLHGGLVDVVIYSIGRSSPPIIYWLLQSKDTDILTWIQHDAANPKKSCTSTLLEKCMKCHVCVSDTTQYATHVTYFEVSMLSRLIGLD